jgi:hypothetical protein
MTRDADYVFPDDFSVSDAEAALLLSLRMNVRPEDL